MASADCSCNRLHEICFYKCIMDYGITCHSTLPISKSINLEKRVTFFRTFNGFKRKLSWLYFYTVLALGLFVTLGQLTPCNGQGSFPLLINGAENRLISTSPEVGTCGYNTITGQLARSAFCRSSTLEESVQGCSNIRHCNQACPHRIRNPVALELTSLVTGNCISPDLANVRPGSEVGARSYYFQDNPDCFLSPFVPVVGNNGEFSISVWVRPDLISDGTIIERRTVSNTLVYALMVSRTAITFDYMTAAGPRFLMTQGGLQTGQWQHLAVQVYDTRISFFVNGLEQDGTPFETQDLLGQIVDSSNVQVKIGQRISGATQFVGRLQDFQFYQDTLTNREIQELATGVFPELHVQSECRCPKSHPRINPANSRFCIRNGDPDTTSDELLRLNELAHPLQFANDGDLSTFWVSSFTNDLIVDIDLTNGQYQVFFVVLQFYSPQPTALTISRKKNDTMDWEHWQFYAEDCSTFGLPNNGPLPTSTSVNCIQFPSNPPYSKSNITFQLLAPEPVARPGYNDFFNTPNLMEFALATQVRIRMQGHYHVSNPRHMYYGIEEVTVNTRCQCNGYAESCNILTNPYKCNCLPESFTEGDNCNQCKPLYNNKPFRHGDRMNSYNCKPCQCHGHADRCVYDRSVDPFPDEHDRGGGGVCVSCQNNTQGRYCDECQSGYYRRENRPLDAVDVCSPCQCVANGTIDGSLICNPVGGQCDCKLHVTGMNCDRCETGYYNLQLDNPDGCEQCQCNPAGSITGDCEQNSGGCLCKANVIGDQCDRCNFGYYNLSALNPLGCQQCECDVDGSISPFCDPTDGQCRCKSSTQGLFCDQCRDGYYGLGNQGCQICDCDPDGTVRDTSCNKETGQCVCKANTEGPRCDQCSANTYNLQGSNQDGCMACSCNIAGTVNASQSCNQVTGQCQCKANVVGQTCNQCAANTFGLDAFDDDGCSPCDCDPSGTVPGGASCNQNTGQCPCLAFRTGLRCDECSSGYFISPSGQGCQACGCNLAGTQLGTVCHPQTGQCQCQGGNSGVTGRRCDSCLPEYFNFNPLLGRCDPCDCDPRGSLNITCDDNTGQCECKELVTGRRCDTCQTGSSNLQETNPQGCSKEPEQQPPPSLSPVSPYAVLLSWGPPDQPNGIITQYTIYRNGSQITSGLFGDTWDGIQEYQDMSLTPYTIYSYVIEASNQAGATQSPPVNVRTLDAIPAGFDVLTISNIGSKTADFVWRKPSGISAPIVNYILTSVTPSKPSTPTQHYSGLDTEYRATDLIPFTNYTFRLTVCTDGSCGQGQPVAAYTESAPPEGVVSPNITAVNITTVFISWDHPLEANGIITHYELFIRGLPDSDGIRDPMETRIFHPAGWYNPRPVVTPREEPAHPPATNYSYDGVEPYTLYEFKITARNQAGTGESDWVIFRTLEAEPLFMPAPSIQGLSSSSLNVSWPQPADSEVRGVVTSYSLYQIVTSTDPFAPPEVSQLIYSNDGDTNHYVVGNLLPYQQYTFVVEVCNSLGCVTSDRGIGSTLPAAPEGQIAPLVDGHNSTSMLVSWSAPLRPNGPEPDYTLHRAPVAFSVPPPRVEKGARFTGAGFYKFPSSVLPVSSYTGMDLEFRVQRPEDATTGVDALLLFAASDGNQEEYIVLQLRGGRPWFLFDPQGGAAGVTPSDGGLTYDDGKWHRIRINRIGTLGSIVVDEFYTGTARAPTSSNIIGQTTGVYIGGLPKDFILQRNDVGNLAVVRNGFAGCLRNVLIEKSRIPTPDWEELSFSSAEDEENTIRSWQGCPTNLQNGTHFPGNGYVMLPSNIFVGGNTFTMSLMMRTEYPTGMLAFSHGDAGQFMLLELLQGNLQLTVNTGSTAMTLTLPGSQLCDGQWQEITVQKVNLLVTISATGGTSLRSMLLSSADLLLTSPLYLGGLPDDSQALSLAENFGLDVIDFGGCLKDIVINQAAISLFDGNVENVYLDGCPSAMGSPCTSPSVTQEYSGTDRIVFDHQLHVFTEYMYRVTASNSIGATSSVWSVGRTREGAPTGVSPPIDPFSLNGYTISVGWQRPTGNTGVLSEYILLAYNQDDPLLTPVEAVFLDTSHEEYSGNITGVIPYTNYFITLKACTAGGCTESNSVSVTTVEEAPDGVQPPQAIHVAGRSLDLAWPLPNSPNGIITLYRLRMNGAVIYEGNRRNHTQAGLNVFTGYQFVLTACTSLGCSDSPEVTITTSQLPPLSVAPPTLFVQGPTSIEAQWMVPNQVNGILERYVLFVSEDYQSTGEAVYNTSDLFTDFVIRDLTPGTLYYISVMACTGGGCTLSPSNTARTSESAPEGVKAPTVVATSPFQLDLFWQPPEQPNGVIISYALFRNNILVQNSSRTTASVNNLTPWSLHVFRLQACTSAGCSFSPEVSARTQEDRPSGTITLAVSTTSPRTVDAIWSSPDQPNGQLIYEVLFNGLFYLAPDMNNYNTLREVRVLFNTTRSNQMFGIGGLIPNTDYTISVRASNSRGSLFSNERMVGMPPGSPDGVTPPTLTPSGPTSIFATWTDPARNNAPGVANFLLTFRPVSNPGAQEELFPSQTRATSYVKSDLQAYTEYEFRLTALNNYGRTESDWVSTFTLEDVPGPVDPPMAAVIDAYTLLVTWEPPDRPNGIIRRINFYQNDVLRIILSGNATEFIADDLIPFTEYSFRIEVCNNEGCSMSPSSSTYQTPAAAPSGQDPPTLTSDTPTSVTITWRPPSSPNGALIGYEIERRLLGSSAVFTVASINADGQRSYRDNSPSISPYTTYEYRIRVSSSAGSYASLWEEVTTRSAAPGGLRPPTVDVLDSTTMIVSWDPPAESNGVIISYTIRMPQPIIYLDNTTLTSFLVHSLIPYTDYEVTMEACTVAGCTESDSTPARTQPAPPQGQEAPRADPITQTYISVLWSPPAFPSGPGIRFELHRQKLRQPLETGTVFGSGFWELIYNGADTSHQDRGLTTFTTYIYRVTTSNQIGSVTSDVSEETTTLAGQPTQSGTLFAFALDHITVHLDWSTPSLLELQGTVTQYYIKINSTEGTKTLSFPPGTNATLLTDLRPNTLYEFHLVISNGAYNVTSNPVMAETLDGAPEGFDRPSFQVLSASSIQVMWREPRQPNGEIISYSIFLDGEEVGEVPDSRLSFILSQLQPYTIYSVQVEVCTVYDCLISNATIFTTLEVTPSGVSPPNLRVLGSSAIEIEWVPPTQPNGIIRGFQLLRRELRTCSESIRPDDSVTCGYVECSTTESVCGGECFSGNKVCCGGQIHDSQPGYQCCDTNYLPIPTEDTSYTCCGGQFHASQPNYQCCRGQYLEVLPGQICCADPLEDRVVVGAGDSCCAGVPYDSTGPQICCAGDFFDRSQGLCCANTFIPFDGTFSDGFNSKCCGSFVIPSNQVCCEEAGQGRAYEPDSGRVCCGLEYVFTDLTLCCTTDSGFSRAHSYLSAEEKESSSDQCCGLEKISSFDACCNGVGYNPLSHVCADRSSTNQGGCGMGTICPVDQAPTAYCNRCDFDVDTTVCAAVEGQYVTASSPSLPSNVVSFCPTALTTVFSADAATYSYLDTELSPYTTYEYAVSVHNSAGSATSPLVNATTHESIPVGVLPPLWMVPAGVLDRITLNWNQPIQPNGVINTYILRRDGIEIFRGLSRSFTDRNGIQPYQQYTYILLACTDVGCASSDEVIAATLQAAPDNFGDPLVTAIDGYSILISWQPPTTPNGIIKEYRVHQSGLDDPVFIGDSSSFTFIHPGLRPYTEYEYTVTACTAGGCTTTNPVSARTDEAPPQGVAHPTHVIFSAFIIEVYWTQPTTPNGIITGYRLYRNGQSVYSGNDSVFLHVDVGLSPNTRYEYIIEASTSAGGTNSSVHIVYTPVSAPQGIPRPTLMVLSSTSILASWTEPTIPNGDIVQYGVILMSGSPDQETITATNDTAVLLNDLTPYTLYDIRVLVCNDGGCGVGPKEYAQTLQAPPEEQGAPTLVATGSSVIEISWEPPQRPNGIIRSYRVFRRVFESTQQLLVCVEGGLENSCTNAGQGLEPFSLYQYKVRVFNDEGETESPWSSVRTLEAPPVGLAEPSVQAVNSFAASAIWTAPNQGNGLILGYRIEYQEVSNDPTLVYPVEVAATLDGDVFQTTFYGLSPFTSYNVRIVAFNGAGEVASPWSNVRTAEGVPADIGLFQVEQNPDGLSLLLRWNPPGLPNGEITEYHIYEDEYLITPVYTGRTREYLFRRLTPFTEYTLVLEACTSAGCGRGDRQTVITAEVAPDNQADPTVGFVDSTSVQLIWKQPVNPNGVITYYEVIRRSPVEVVISSRRRRDTDDSSLTQTQVVYTEYNTNADLFNYTDNALLPFRMYEYRINAFNSKGNSQSNWVPIQTDQAPPTGVLPPSVTHISNVPGSLIVSWLPPGEANGIIQAYRLQRNDSAPFSFDIDDDLTYTDTGLEPFTIYGYTITICSGGGCTTSEVTTIRTLESAPIFVPPPTAEAISANEISINWTMPSLETGEIINLQLKVDGEVAFDGLTGVVVIPNLIPYQEYEFVLVACTSGGCSESRPAYERPFQAQPEGMAPPILRALDSRRVEVTWSEPEFPNGVILRYELRRDGKLVYDGDALRWQDFGDGGAGLTPGQEYSYIVTAINSEGRAISPPASVVTSADAPAGLSPPSLTPRSASIIAAMWQNPLFPNGAIQNFTLFRDNQRVYSGLEYNFDVRNLEPFTEYEFYIEACTQQGCAQSEEISASTLESAPLGQIPPTLKPLANGIVVEWAPPTQPNGIITGYQLLRRRIFSPSEVRSEPISVFNSTAGVTQYSDMDPLLVPDERYEYMVISRNSAGQVASQWAIITTLEAAPQGMLPPDITVKTATSLTVNIRVPTQPNGRITQYNIYRNGSQIESTEGTVYTDTGLEPFTVYSYVVEACTMGGCSSSPQTITQTKQDHPTGLSPPTVMEKDSTWIHLEWQHPDDANGIISNFEFQFRASCPLSEQPFTQTCQEKSFTTINKGLSQNHNVSGLSPYTRYDFQVKALNAEGFAVSQAIQETTEPSAPEYNQDRKPVITSNSTGQVVRIEWTGTFILNGKLREYILEENGDKVYSGTSTADTRPLKNEEYEFVITVVTEAGEVSSPAIIFTSVDFGGTAGAITQWYQSVWFIAIVILIGIVILFILLGVALSRITPSRPYERERQPLPPRQKRAHNFTFASSFKHPDTESIMDPIPKSISHASSMQSLHNSYTNPSYPPPYHNSRPGSRASDTIDKTPLKYLSDDDGGWDDPSPIPHKLDSGMVSMGDYDDDQMTNVSQTYSYTKEQTMFTDTHL
ncbi:Usherin [Holothuria leucospilota]|uniref:Usherin n=1 Tax=Holothuria leucospilota TaxID=206669 RepID=A0A9Q1CHP0_HOLLE|nr:Usherin [Holothuria leucospilota]